MRSQIAALKRDYRAANKDRSKVPAAWKGLASDAGIEFVLTTKDPRGKETDGITRTKTSRKSFGVDDSACRPGG